MAKRRQKVGPVVRPVAPGDTAEVAAGASPGVEADAARRAHDEELGVRFRKAAEDVHEDITGRLEEARRGHPDLYFLGLDIEPEVAELKKNILVIRKLIAALNTLKQLHSQRVEDLKRMQDLAAPFGK